MKTSTKIFVGALLATILAGAAVYEYPLYEHQFVTGLMVSSCREPVVLLMVERGGGVKEFKLNSAQSIDKAIAALKTATDASGHTLDIQHRCGNFYGGEL